MTAPAPNFIGINVSGLHARAALVDNEGQIITRREIDFTPENIVAAVRRVIGEQG